MKLIKARVQNYRSIVDSGLFEIEELKTILVGPNEAGKTVLLKALQQLNKPEDIEGFKAIRDYPRSLYNDITTGQVKAEEIEVVRGYFQLDKEDKELVDDDFKDCIYVLYRKLDNSGVHYLENAPMKIKYEVVNKDLIRLFSHIDKQFEIEETETTKEKPSVELKIITDKFYDSKVLTEENSKELLACLAKFYSLIDEENEKEEERYNKIVANIKYNSKFDEVIKVLRNRLPVFVLFNNYFKVKPSIHLEHLAQRVEQKILEDDKFYDYGNLCLLKLLGFSARELATIGSTPSPAKNDMDGLTKYRDTLDNRTYQLNAASVRLTKEIKDIWNPNPNRPEAEKIRISADGQYLKVVVEDELKF